MERNDRNSPGRLEPLDLISILIFIELLMLYIRNYLTKSKLGNCKFSWLDATSDYYCSLLSLLLLLLLLLLSLLLLLLLLILFNL